MKTVIVTPSFSGGGAERVAVNLANFYAGQGHAVCLVAVQEHGPYRTAVSPLVRVVDLRVKRLRFALLPVILALRAVRADAVLSVIRSTNILVGAASRFVSIPSLVFREANTLDGLRAPTLNNRLLFQGMRFAYRRADWVVANSRDTAADLVAGRIGDPEKIRVIGNPVLAPDHADLLAKKVSHPWSDDPNIRLLVSVGRLVPQKRHDLTIRAFARLRAERDDVRLLIVGDGGELSALRDLQAELDLSEAMAFLPFQQNPYPLYGAADVFVLASDWEGFGNVLVEALAAGTTIVSTDCPGGPKEILAGGQFGRLVPVRDVEALAHAMGEALDNPHSPDDLKHRANSFSVEFIAQQYGEVLFKGDDGIRP